MRDSEHNKCDYVYVPFKICTVIPSTKYKITSKRGAFIDFFSQHTVGNISGIIG